MRTLREDGVRKVLAGLTSAEEVISMTLDDVN
jgi:type II secretory ATPase GspE/PulE/Tfp pilus assembly ATPase PilB-like protein